MYHAEHSCCPPHSGAEDVSFFYVTIPRHLFSKRVVSKREEETRFNTEPDRRDKERSKRLSPYDTPAFTSIPPRSWDKSEQDHRLARIPTNSFSAAAAEAHRLPERAANAGTAHPSPGQAEQHRPRPLAVMTPHARINPSCPAFCDIALNPSSMAGTSGEIHDRDICDDSRPHHGPPPSAKR